jgi:hypothetical protein
MLTNRSVAENVANWKYGRPEIKSGITKKPGAISMQRQLSATIAGRKTNRAKNHHDLVARRAHFGGHGNAWSARPLNI